MDKPTGPVRAWLRDWGWMLAVIAIAPFAAYALVYYLASIVVVPYGYR